MRKFILLCTLTLSPLYTHSMSKESLPKQQRGFLFKEQLEKIPAFDPKNNTLEYAHTLFKKVVYAAQKDRSLVKKQAVESNLYSFNQTNDFVRGEIVLVARKDKSYTYGVVMGTGNKDIPSILVQVDWLASRDVLKSALGKIKITPKYQSQVERRQSQER